MVKVNVQDHKTEELLAELAAAVNRVGSQRGCKGAFIDIELDLWDALQAQLSRLTSFTTAEVLGRNEVAR